MSDPFDTKNPRGFSIKDWSPKGAWRIVKVGRPHPPRRGKDWGNAWDFQKACGQKEHLKIAICGIFISQRTFRTREKAREYDRKQSGWRCYENRIVKEKDLHLHIEAARKRHNGTA